jgi:hypothetical protein
MASALRAAGAAVMQSIGRGIECGCLGDLR